MKNLGENSRYARSGPTPLQQDCVFQIWSSTARCNRTVNVSFRSEDSRCGAKPLLPDCVRVNSFGTGSQHIPDLEQHPHQMRDNSFVRFDNLDLHQHRCYRTVYGSIRFIMYYYDMLRFLFFFCVAFIPQHLASSSSNTSHFLHSTEDVLNLIYNNDTDVHFPIRSMGAGECRDPCILHTW